MPWATSLSRCCQGAAASMPVAETKAPVLGWTLGAWAGQSGGTKEGAPVLQESEDTQGWGAGAHREAVLAARPLSSV